MVRIKLVQQVVGVMSMALVAGNAFASVSHFNRIYKHADVVFSEPAIFAASSVNWLRCNEYCSKDSNCNIWSWDSATLSCKTFESNVISSKTHSPTTTTEIYARPEAQVTYFIIKGDGSSWMEAKAQCKDHGGLLAYVNDKDWMNKLRVREGIQGFFVGVSRDNVDSPWHDEHNNELPESELYWSLSLTSGPNEHCVAHWISGIGKIMCGGKRPLAAFCKIDESKKSCNTFKSTEINGKIHFPTTTTETKGTYLIVKGDGTWLDAKVRCKSLGGTLAYVSDRDWMNKLHTIEGVKGFFVGVSRDDLMSPWHDENNKELPESELYWTARSDSHGRYEHCVAHWYSGIHDIRCDTIRPLAAFCKAEDSALSPTAPPEIAVDSAGYFIVRETGTWLDGKARCEERGGLLAFVNDRDWMTNLRATEYFSGIYVGLSRDDVDSPWHDEGNNEIPFDEIPWSPTASLGPLQHCMVFWRTGADAIECDTFRPIPFLCKK